MPKKVISYKLNVDGTIPDIVDDGGYLVKDGNDTPNAIFIGITKDNVDLADALEIFETENDLSNFVSTYLEDNTYTTLSGETHNFVLADAISALFAKIA